MQLDSTMTNPTSTQLSAFLHRQRDLLAERRGFARGAAKAFKTALAGTIKSKEGDDGQVANTSSHTIRRRELGVRTHFRTFADPHCLVGRLFRAAGSTELTAACRALGGCATGDVQVTSGFKLIAKVAFPCIGTGVYASDMRI